MTYRWRSFVSALGFMLLGALVAALAAWIVIADGKPDLEPWHRIVLREELEASPEVESWSLDDYLALEERVFAEAERRLRRAEAADNPLSRYRSDSPTNPRGFATDYNRTFTLGPQDARGGVLLLHGLSDSPYSLRSVAEILARRGFHCVALRLPGHGTLPAGLRTARKEDWEAAVRLGARAVTAELDAGEPFLVVGYSNGAALALDYTLAALDDPELPTPQRLLFLSPAFAVSPLAAMARVQRLVGSLPGLEKLLWNSVNEEHDPYKYNSFALRAAEEIFGLTRRIEKRLQRLEAERRMGELPPILTLQSVVDATVPPVASLDRLYGRMTHNGSQLVLFDVNRATGAEAFLRPMVNDLLRRAQPDTPFRFELTLVTNADPETLEVVARTRPAGELEPTVEGLGLRWPRGVYSLSHVAVPFPPDDPIYGVGPRNFPFPFGALEPRGERGALVLSMNLLMRLRYNPFFPYLERRIVDFVAASDAAMAEESRLMRGRLVFGHEVRTFTECGSDGESWVVDRTAGELRSVYERVAELPYQPIYAEVVALPGPAPESGFGAGYDSGLELFAIVQASDDGSGCSTDAG